MRKTFSDDLYLAMSKDKKIFFILGDVGFGFFDKLKKDFPDRVINPGASEQLMMGMASGMAMDGFKPIVYSITPFILFRPFEFIRNFISQWSLRAYPDCIAVFAGLYIIASILSTDIIFI